MLTDSQAEQLRAMVRAGHGFREVLPKGLPDIASLLLAYHDEIERLRRDLGRHQQEVDGWRESVAMACEQPCGECRGCFANPEDTAAPQPGALLLAKANLADALLAEALTVMKLAAGELTESPPRFPSSVASYIRREARSRGVPLSPTAEKGANRGVG